jgi:hypothetical protein
LGDIIFVLERGDLDIDSFASAKAKAVTRGLTNDCTAMLVTFHASGTALVAGRGVGYSGNIRSDISAGVLVLLEAFAGVGVDETKIRFSGHRL